MKLDEPIEYEIPKGEVYAIDVDGFLTNETCWTEYEMKNATPNQSIIDWVNDKHRRNRIVIHTARRWCYCSVTVDWLNKHGVLFHSVAMGKLPAQYYCDDHAVNIKDIPLQAAHYLDDKALNVEDL